MNKLSEIIKQFPEKKITVVGDLMLDKYIYGSVQRISPEADVPVLKVDREVYDLGGAANVASNIRALGGAVCIFGFVGNDENGDRIKNLLSERGIDYHFDYNSMTTLKIRPTGRQQLMRMDYEEDSNKIFSSEIKREMEKQANSSDLIVISDYAKGAITKNLVNFLKPYFGKTIVGSKPKNKNLYKGVFLTTLNEDEAFEMSSKKNIKVAGEYLRKKLNSNVLITRGEEGMILFPYSSKEQLEIPTYAKEVFDVTGAGDTVLSVIALSVASNASLENAAIIANHAASIAISKSGTYNVTLSELEQKIFGEERKVKSLDELKTIISDLKRKKKRIVWTNGCFSLLHEGHVYYLKKAKKLGDYLVVGLNSDESVLKLKGKEKLIRPEQARAEILSSLEPVDYVMIFPETSVEKYLKALQPQIYVKAGDYDILKINQDERKVIESYGGKIIFVPIKDKISTTKIIEEIKNGK